MFKRLLELLQNAIKKMLGYKSIAQLTNNTTNTISDKMLTALDLWKAIYKDESPWLNEDTGIYSLGLGKQICQTLQQQTLSEMDSAIIEPGSDDEIQEDKLASDTLNTRAAFLNDIYTKRLLSNLPTALEKALALGGMIIKPYISNEQIYLDFNYQGEFYPIAFDDDGNITDIAFIDRFSEEGYLYTKVERQTFIYSTQQVIIENKAFKIELQHANNDDTEEDLGKQIPLADVERWSGISEEPVTIENVEKSLYGYFKVPLANNVDMHSPLGISIFSPAVSLIKRADHQFSRLDWEYNGGQLAIDVDPTAVSTTEGYYGTSINLDDCKDRLYRSVDLGSDETYKQWSPALRDANYLNGLNAYLNRIEDVIGLARGTLSQVDSEARTATEIKLLKQRTYITISDLQKHLEKCILDVVYSMNVFIDLYGLAPSGEYDTKIDWKDSILTDTDTELEQKLNLQTAGILSKAEVRAWYTGENLATAQAEIDKMEKANEDKLMNDLFTSKNQETTLESDEDNSDNQQKDMSKDDEKAKNEDIADER